MKTLFFVRITLLASAIAGAFTQPQLALMSLTAFAGTQLIEQKAKTAKSSAPLPHRTSEFDHWQSIVKERLIEQEHHLEKLDRDLSALAKIQTNASDLFSLFEQLQARVSTIETSFQVIGDTFAQELEQFRTTEEQLLQRLRQMLQENGTKVELLFDRDESLKHFNRALSDVRKKLRIVNPWVRQQRFGYLIDVNNTNRPSLKNLLQRNKQISLGWGYYSDLRDDSRIRDNYDGLPELLELRQTFPQHLQLKCFNTHEKYIIVDGRWAMLGSHNFLNSYGQSSQREIGVIITDQAVIQKMINRYDNIQHDQVSEQKFLKVVCPQVSEKSLPAAAEGNPLSL